MKKYRHLLLLVILFSSLLALLLYRNEYNKLRSTFEILSYFSAPVNPSNCLLLNETVLQNYKYSNLFVSYPPQWIQIGEYSIYSAFWYPSDSINYAKAIGVGPKNGNPDFECHVWFDHQDTLFSLNGINSYSTLHHNYSALTTYEFICKVDVTGVKGVPYVLVLIQRTNKDVKKVFIPLLINSLSHLPHNASGLGICIKPDQVGFSKSDLVEFIAFHQIVGLSDLIVYDNGIHHGVLTKLKQLESMNSFIRTISILPWNFPYEDSFIEDRALVSDCLSRSAGILPVVSILEWNQYIVPRKRDFVQEILKTTVEIGTKHLKATSQVCCTNLKNDKRVDMSWPLVLRKTHCIKTPQEAVLVIHPGKHNVNNKGTLKQSLATINIYQDCDAVKSLIEHDSSSHKFIIDLMSNKLLQIWKSGMLFTHS